MPIQETSRRRSSTHLHSDHTVGYPDLIFTPWVMCRESPLTVYGPPGIKAMIESILKAWAVDIDARVNGRHNATGYQVHAHEIDPGVVYQDRNVTVTGFAAHTMKCGIHSAIASTRRTEPSSSPATRRDPGDYRPWAGCDVLIHECYSLAS